VSSEPALAIFIDPPSHHFLKDRLFEPSTNPYSGDDILAPYQAIKKYFEGRGVPVHTADKLADDKTAGKKVYFSIGRTAELRHFQKRPDAVVSTYFAMECPIDDPEPFKQLPGVARDFKHMLSWSDGVALEPFVGERLKFERYQWPQSFDGVHDALWSRQGRKFLAMINANKLPADYRYELYTQRVKAVAYFHRFGEIDLFGPHWEKAPRNMRWGHLPGTVQKLLVQAWETKQGILPDRDYAACAAASRGPVKSKAETLSQYKFALCFENMILRGWMTEKLFDCFFAGVVPVYWGAPDVLDFVPASCFIDYRNFQDFGPEFEKFS